MKKLILISTVLPLLFLTTAVFAQENKQEKTVTVGRNEVINKDYFAFGDRIEISGTVNGDVYTAGGQVLVDGTINGDLIAAGGTVTISGTVSQDVRVGGGQVTISGRVGRNLTVGGGNIEITGDGTISGSVVAGGGNITIGGPVSGNMMVGAGNLTLSNTVGGSVDAGVGTIRLAPNARIAGNLTYWSDRDVSIAQDAAVSGSITKNIPPEFTRPQPKAVLGVLSGIDFFFKIISLISTLVIGFIFLRFFPNYTESLLANLKSKPWASAGIGFLALILTPIASILLLITVGGIPLAFMLFWFFIISLYIVRVFSIYWLGRFIAQSMGRGNLNRYLSFIVGLLVYYIVQVIPIVGSLMTFIVIVASLGAHLITDWNLYWLLRKNRTL